MASTINSSVLGATIGPDSVLKPIKKYLQQANQLQKLDPLLAYYCRMHAVSEAMKLKQKSKEDLKIVNNLVEWLEQQKHLRSSREEGRNRCEAMALSIFDLADTQDRAGKANKETALSFHASFVLMEVSRQFGDLSSDLLEKNKYAKWKTADIFKALAAGTTPHPGPLTEPTTENQDTIQNATPDSISSLQNSSTSIATPMPVASENCFSSNVPPPYVQTNTANTAISPAYSNASSLSSASGESSGSLLVVANTMARNRTDAMTECEKLLKHASSALRFDDIDTAVNKLQQSLALLLPFRKKI